jgi:hypothetical protein
MMGKVIGTRGVARALHALIGLSIGAAACTSGTSTGYYYYDPYLYSYYYPADLAYSSAYWAYPWDYSTWYLYQYTGSNGSADGGTTGGGSTGMRSVGAAIRALARGQSVCPGQVTVTPKTGTPACEGGETSTARGGASVVFNNCALPDGGVVSGTVDIQAAQSASQRRCSEGTMITVNYTTTTTNLMYMSPQGGRLVIPNQTDMSTISFDVGKSPKMLTVTSNGRMQFYDSPGSLVADMAVDGTRVFTNASDGQSYTTDGTVNIHGQGENTASGTLTGTGLVRSGTCCRPTGGTLVLSLTGGAQPGRHEFTFGASCGTATLDGSEVTLPACL